MSFNITVEGGSSVRLPTKGKYCDRDIVVTAASGGAELPELPELTNPGTAEDMLEGKELIGSDGKIVTGTMQTVRGSVTEQVAPGFAYNIGPCVRMQYSPTERLVLEPDTSAIDLVAPLSDFGDSETGDVTKGKTFTSAAGLLAVGTKEDPEIKPEQEKTLQITENGMAEVSPDEGYTLSKVALTVNVPEREAVLQSKSVSPSTEQQTVAADDGYDGLSDVTVEAMPIAPQATPSITVSTAGLITASSTQEAGYVEAGTQSATMQLTKQATKTVTPTTAKQTAVAKGRYTTGAVYVAGDANLLAENIKSGVSIFGVAGAAITLPDGITAMEVIEYTPASDVGSGTLKLDHNLGVVPNFVICYRKDGEAVDAYLNWYLVTPMHYNTLTYYGAYCNGTSYGPVGITVDASYFTATQFKAKYLTNKMLAGTTYVYLVGVVELD